MATTQSSLSNRICERMGCSDAEIRLPIMAEECRGTTNPFNAKLPVAEVDCSVKRYCKDMSISDEARASLVQCGMKNLDRDGDGVPYESLCD